MYSVAYVNIYPSIGLLVLPRIKAFKYQQCVTTFSGNLLKNDGLELIWYINTQQLYKLQGVPKNPKPMTLHIIWNLNALAPST